MYKVNIIVVYVLKYSLGYKKNYVGGTFLELAWIYSYLQIGLNLLKDET